MFPAKLARGHRVAVRARQGRAAPQGAGYIRGARSPKPVCMATMTNMMKVPSSRTLSVSSHLSQLGRAEEKSMRLYVRASFEVRAETEWGDYVVITGSSEQLGDWRPERGLRMVTTEATYPIWQCEPLLRCTSDTIEYKFCIMKQGVTPEWEPLPNNRTISLNTAVDDVQVVAEWGSQSAWHLAPSHHNPSLIASPYVGRREPPSALSAALEARDGSAMSAPSMAPGAASMGVSPSEGSVAGSFDEAPS